MSKSNIEETKLYHVYLDFIMYIEMITEKYPSNTKNTIVKQIKDDLYQGMRYILLAYKAFDKKDKLGYLNQLDITIKMLKIYSRISYKKKYINIKNYEAWSRKINNICIGIGGWINSCLKQ